MADLPQLLLASLNPDTRKRAEQSLNTISTQPGFLDHILRLTLDNSQDRSVRLSASVYLKNVAKLRWEEDVRPIPEQEKVALRSQLLPAMLSLTAPPDKAVRSQIAETVSLIAELDFPEKWKDLIDQLVASLSPTDYNANSAVLETAHSIFVPWRALVRSDDLFRTINIVLNAFMPTFLQLFRQTSSMLLSSPPDPLVAQCMVLLLQIFYDLTCQDLPPAIEDNHAEFFGPQNGYLHAFLAWDPAELKGNVDDTTPSLSSQIKAVVLEIAELHIKKYPDAFQEGDDAPAGSSAVVAAFVQEVWTLIGANKLPGVADDALVAQSLRFISGVVRSGNYKSLFSALETISSLVEGVVVPNISMREVDVERFEDDPLEFVRLGQSLFTADVATRREAAADVIQALVGSGFEAQTTSIVGDWIGRGLTQYSSNKENWQAKDGAVYLFTAVATRGYTMQQGAASTNALVDVVKFFSDHVFQDLQAVAGTVHPILQVDSIRFLQMFRNQLTKSQLLSVLPLLVQHLGSENYVISTHAAIAIERILSIRQGNQLMFVQADVQEFAPNLVNGLLSKIEAAGAAEKVAENDHLMRCAMRVIVTARQTLMPTYQTILTRLVAILNVISKNPSNPRFDQYIFESISGLMRFVVSGSSSTLPIFERNLFPLFTTIIQQDIEQYVPYVFQVLAQMLELHPDSVPETYRSLLPLLFTPASWQQKGSIPGLVRLLTAFLARDAKGMLAAQQIPSVLAVVQQRLIPSKLNDAWGFELLQAVIRYVPPTDMRQYIKAVLLTLLTRMHTSKTDAYVYSFAKFILYMTAIRRDGLTPDYLISAVDEIQPQLWSQVMTSFIIPQIPKFAPKDRKLVAVGVTRLLTQSSLMLQEPTVRTWPAAFTSLARLFKEPQSLVKEVSLDPHAGITEIDFEEQTAGYQAAYSRIAASETAEVDPVAYVKNPQEFLGQELVKMSGYIGQDKLRRLLSATDTKITAFLIQALASAGYAA
ncbi:importin alpha re-exporter [Fistulina hepatica ATCC 64428]|nr:importin alpha re-exporter [Fistulina hepatica ATCC 64428]